MPKGRDEMGTKKLKKTKGKKMTNGLQFRSLQFGTKPPTVLSTAGGTDDVLSKFTPEQRQRLERFANNAWTIITQSVEYLKADLKQLPSVSALTNAQEQEVMVNSLFLARYGKLPRQFQETLFGNAVAAYAKTL